MARPEESYQFRIEERRIPSALSQEPLLREKLQEGGIKNVMEILEGQLIISKQSFFKELMYNSIDAIKCYAKVANLPSIGIPNNEIRIVCDETRGVFSVQDRGVGMSKDDLLNYMGTIFKSGFAHFIGTKAKSSVQTFGEHGIGILTCFLVSHKITITSKKYNSDSAYQWQSGGKSFTLKKLVNSTFPRGTKVELHFLHNQRHFFSRRFIKGLITRNFHYANLDIHFTFIADEKPDSHQDQKERKMGNPIIFKHSPRSPVWISKSRDPLLYQEAYTFVTGDMERPRWSILTPLGKSGLFQALLFVPSSKNIVADKNFCLYRDDVLIIENYDILPECLRFFTGVISCRKMPIKFGDGFNAEKFFNYIKRELIDACIPVIEEFIKNKSFCLEYEESLKDFFIYVNDNSKFINMALVDGLRFASFSHGKVSLIQYISNMLGTQKFIYFIMGDSGDHCDSILLAKKLRQKKINVLNLDNEKDRKILKYLKEYAGVPLQCITWDNTTLPDETIDRSSFNRMSADCQELCTFMHSCLEDVEKVYISEILFQLPCAVTTLMAMESYGDRENCTSTVQNKKNFAINPINSIIARMGAKIKSGDRGYRMTNLIQILYGSALLKCDYDLVDPGNYCQQIYNEIEFQLNLNDTKLQKRSFYGASLDLQINKPKTSDIGGQEFVGFDYNAKAPGLIDSGSALGYGSSYDDITSETDSSSGSFATLKAEGNKRLKRNNATFSKLMGFSFGVYAENIKMKWSRKQELEGISEGQ